MDQDMKESSQLETIDWPFILKKKFDNLEQFQQQFDTWCNQHYVNYFIADSKYINNKALEHLKYKYVQFECVHSGEPTDKGTLSDDATAKRGCEFKVRLIHNPYDGNLVITKSNSKHNHPCSRMIFDK